MGLLHNANSHYDERNRGNSSSNISKNKNRNTLRICGWLLFVFAQCCLLKMYHDVAYMQSTSTNGNVDGDGEGFSSTSSNSDLYTQFERELVLQGILGVTTKEKDNHVFETTKTIEEEARHKQQQRPSLPRADGIFNGYPIYKFQNSSSDELLPLLYSQFHCVGETWEPPIKHRKSKTYLEQSWMHRSCQFQLLCYDTSTQEYVIYLDPDVHHPFSEHNNNTQTNTTESDDTKSQSQSPLIHKLLKKQKKQKTKEKDDAIIQKKLDGGDDTYNYNFSQFKKPSYFDDTSTVYRNNTVIVDAKGEITAADTHWNHGEIKKNQYGDTSYGVSIGSINGKWGEVDGQRLKWFPTIKWNSIEHESTKNYYDIYTLPSSVIMIPFHSLSASNPGHLVWDDFLPMYTLLEMYGFTHLNIDNEDHPLSDDTAMDLLPMRYKLPGGRGLWAGCDWLDSKADACHNMLQKFGKLVGTKRSKQKYSDHLSILDKNTPSSQLMQVIPNPNDSDRNSDNDNQTKTTITITNTKIPITTNKDIQLQLLLKHKHNNGDSDSDDIYSKPKLVCSKNGLAGFGGISDHGDGKRGHGWSPGDYVHSQNSGRGGQLYNFRTYMIQNLFYENSNSLNNNNNKQVVRIPNSITDLKMNEPLVVLFSSYSSETRGASFEYEAEQLRETIRLNGNIMYGIDNDIEIQIKTYTFSKLSLEEQIMMTSKASIFVTACGGGAITASFLPRGGSVLIYYLEKGGVHSNVRTKLPARLDWDFFNNASYLHVHWIPANSRRKDEEQNKDLILMELSRIYKQRKQFYGKYDKKKK